MVINKKVVESDRIAIYMFIVGCAIKYNNLSFNWRDFRTYMYMWLYIYTHTYM